MGVRVPSDMGEGVRWGVGAVTFLLEKITQSPNARVLKSGCKRTKNALKTKTFTKIVIESFHTQ